MGLKNILAALIFLCGGILFSQPRIQKKYIYDHNDWRLEYPFHSIIDMKDTLEVHRFDRGINSYSEHILTYNTDNLLTEELVRHFDGVWFDYERQSYIYDGKLLIEFKIERKDNFEWYTVKKTKNYYDEQEQLVKKEEFLFDENTGEMKLDTFYEYEWQDGFLLQMIQFLGLTMNPWYQTDLVYDSTNQIKESVRSRILFYGTKLSDRFVYERDDSGKIITKIYQEWDDEWINLEKEINNYFPNGRISLSIQYEWEGSFWKPKSKSFEEIIDSPEIIIIAPVDGFPISAGTNFTFTWWGHNIGGVEINTNSGDGGAWSVVAVNLPEKGFFTTELSGVYSENFTTIVKSAQSLEAKSVNILVRQPAVLREYAIMNTDTLSIPISNDGMIGDLYPYQNEITFDNKNLIWTAGFYLSGLFGNELYGSGMASASLAEQFVPGAAYQKYQFDPLENLYYVNKLEPPFGEAWHDWEIAAALGAEFYDGNGDGIYQSIDLNNNGIWDNDEDSPFPGFDNNSYSIYHDGNFQEGDFIMGDSREQGIEMRQTVFTMDSSFLYSENAFFVKYEIFNRNKFSIPMEDAYFLIYADTELGDGWDDLFGTDTIRNAIYTYNDDADDIFGENPPALFMDCIYSSSGEAMKMSASSHFLCGDPSYGDPLTTQQVRYYATGFNFYGERMDPCYTNYSAVYNCDCEDVNPVFAYSGNPIIDDGWIHTYACDLRLIAAMGPFSLNPGEKVSFLIGYYAATGNGSEDAIVQTRKISDYYQEYFNPVITSIEENEQPGKEYTYSLGQNYPNPFNPSTTITFSIAEHEEVSLEVFDILGRRVATLINRTLPAGKHEVKFNAENLCSGVYFYNVRAGEYINTRKMILLR